MSKTNETKAKQTAITILYPDGSKRRFGSHSTASRFINAGFRMHGSDEAFYASLMRQFEDMQTTLKWEVEDTGTDAAQEEAETSEEPVCVIEVHPEPSAEEPKTKGKRAKKGDRENSDKFKFLGDDSVVRFEVGKEYVENLKDGKTATVKVVVRKGQIIKISHGDGIDAKLQSKFLKVVDGIEVTCDLSIKAK